MAERSVAASDGRGGAGPPGRGGAGRRRAECPAAAWDRRGDEVASPPPSRPLSSFLNGETESPLPVVVQNVISNTLDGGGGDFFCITFDF